MTGERITQQLREQFIVVQINPVQQRCANDLFIVIKAKQVAVCAVGIDMIAIMDICDGVAAVFRQVCTAGFLFSQGIFQFVDPVL